MNISYTLAMTAAAALLAASSAAFAADITKGPYETDGFITASTCGAISPTLKVGTPTDSAVGYPGAGGAGMTLVTPSTTSSTAAGKGSTTVCVASSAVPATGLNGATIPFKCYIDTTSGPASSSVATVTTKFTVGHSHSASADTVSAASTLAVGAISCTFTTDSSWQLE